MVRPKLRDSLARNSLPPGFGGQLNFRRSESSGQLEMFGAPMMGVVAPQMGHMGTQPCQQLAQQMIPVHQQPTGLSGYNPSQGYPGQLQHPGESAQIPQQPPASWGGAPPPPTISSLSSKAGKSNKDSSSSSSSGEDSRTPRKHRKKKKGKRNRSDKGSDDEYIGAGFKYLGGAYVHGSKVTLPKHQRHRLLEICNPTLVSRPKTALMSDLEIVKAMYLITNLPSGLL